MSTATLNKSFILIGIGVVNILHASMHIVQFFQSLILISASTHNEEDGFFNELLHNPILNIVWAIIGIFTLYLGIKDFRHHRKCKH